MKLGGRTSEGACLQECRRGLRFGDRCKHKAGRVLRSGRRKDCDEENRRQVVRTGREVQGCKVQRQRIRFVRVIRATDRACCAGARVSGGTARDVSVNYCLVVIYGEVAVILLARRMEV